MSESAAQDRREQLIEAALDVAMNEGLDDDWECVRASDLDRLRAALGLTLMAGASDE